MNLDKIEIQCKEDLIGDTLVAFPFIKFIIDKNQQSQKSIYIKNKWVSDLLPSRIKQHLVEEPIPESNETRSSTRFILSIHDVFEKYCLTDHPTIGFFKLFGYGAPTSEFAILPEIEYNNLDKQITYDFVLSPFSVSGVDNKVWQNEKWQELVDTLNKKYSICVIGSTIDQKPFNGVDYLYGLPAKTICSIIHHSTCTITLDNGVGHISHAINQNNHLFLYPSFIKLGWSNYPNSNMIYKKMNEISVNEVIKKIQKIWKNKTGNTL